MMCHYFGQLDHGAQRKTGLLRWLLLTVLVLGNGVTGTMIKLNNGGFEDIVIAINPGLPEDDKLLNNIKVR